MRRLCNMAVLDKKPTSDQDADDPEKTGQIKPWVGIVSSDCDYHRLLKNAKIATFAS